MKAAGDNCHKWYYPTLDLCAAFQARSVCHPGVIAVLLLCGEGGIAFWTLGLLLRIESTSLTANPLKNPVVGEMIGHGVKDFSGFCKTGITGLPKCLQNVCVGVYRSVPMPAGTPSSSWRSIPLQWPAATA